MSLKKLLGTSLLCFSLVLSNVTALAADQNNVSDNKELTQETQEQTDTTQEVQTQSESQENEDGSAAPEQSEENPDAQDTSENGTVEQTTEGQTEETQNTESEEAGVETQNADGVSLLNTFPEYEEEKPVYNGITIDGNFSDWNAVAKTSVEDGSIIDAAMVFDGDWVYIYLKDTGNGAAFHAGERSHGTYELLTDTGRRTSFVLRENGIEGVKDAKVKYSNDQYEIAIPASNLKKYRSTISFGYAQAKTPMISGVSNLQGGGNIDGSFSGITIDGNFDDWADYNHQLIEYSTNGDYGDDADGALYLNDHTLYGHVKTYRLRNNNPYYQVELRFNEVDSQNIYFQFITVDDNGNINWNPQMDCDGTTKEYYMIDMRGWHGASTLTELEDESYGNKILGHAYIRMNSSDDTELEYEIDLEKLSSYISTSNSTPYEMAVTDMKTIQAKYQNIGSQWVTIAGTSSGPVVGVVLCISTVACVLAYRRRKQKGIA